MNEPTTEERALRTRVLLLLLFAYVFNFIDRNIVGVLAVPIREEFRLSDTALSQLGIAFGIFYAVIAIPIAWAADRKSRVNIIAGAVALWSLFTAACGMVQNYTQLVVARMGVAVGEAGGIAPSYSLISDYFPREKRSRALAFYSLGIPIGSALGVFFGGWLAAHLSWRSAFIIVGLLGLPAALLNKLLIPEPQRGRFDAATPVAAPPGGDVARALFANPSFWLLSFGAASGSILGYGLIFWLPSFFNRSFGLALELLRPRGQLVLKSTFHGKTELDAAPIVVDEISIVGSRCGRFAPALDLLKKKAVDVDSLISEEYSLSKGVHAMRRAGTKGVLKVLLRP